MNNFNSDSPLDSYWQYIHHSCPQLDVELLSPLTNEVSDNSWENPESSLELNNFAVITLIEAEKCQNQSLRAVNLEIAVRALQQSLTYDKHPLCAAHLALIHSMLGEMNRAMQIALPTFIETLNLAHHSSEDLPSGLVYFPPQSKNLVINCQEVFRSVLQAENGYKQALLLLAEVMCNSQLVFYNPNGLRYFQLAAQILPNSAAINLQLGIAYLMNQRAEGLLYLQRASKLAPDCGAIAQALYLSYQELKEQKTINYWHKQAFKYHQQFPQSLEWDWVKIKENSPFTYVPFDNNLLLAVEANLSSIVTSVLIAQGDWFEKEMEFWRNQIQPGMTVIDVGANVGVYTFSAAQKVGSTGKVFAVEPFSACVQCMEETCQINQLSWVKICPGAASDRNGKAYLAIHNASELNEIIVPDHTNNFRSQQYEEVNCFSLDSLVESENISNLDWIKIDAEGHEMKVLEGSELLLQRFSPRIIYENIAGSKGSNQSVAELLQSKGYQLFRYQPFLEDLVQISSLDDLNENLNIIALPTEAK